MQQVGGARRVAGQCGEVRQAPDGFQVAAVLQGLGNRHDVDRLAGVGERLRRPEDSAMVVAVEVGFVHHAFEAIQRVGAGLQ